MWPVLRVVPSPPPPGLRCHLLIRAGRWWTRTQTSGLCSYSTMTASSGAGWQESRLNGVLGWHCMFIHGQHCPVNSLGFNLARFKIWPTNLLHLGNLKTNLCKRINSEQLQNVHRMKKITVYRMENIHLYNYVIASTGNCQI